MFIVFCFVSFPTISKVPYPLYQPTNPPVQSVLSIHLIIFPVSNDQFLKVTFLGTFQLYPSMYPIAPPVIVPPYIEIFFKAKLENVT